MAPNVDELRAVVAAVEEPDLRRGLGELGMLRGVELSRRKLSVQLAVPSAGWPTSDGLAERLREALRPVDGLGEVVVEIGVMTDSERAELVRRLGTPVTGEGPDGADPGRSSSSIRRAPAEVPEEAVAPPRRTPGSPPGPLSQAKGNPNRYLSPGSRTRVIGISSGKGGVGKSSVTVNLAVALAARGLDVGLLDADVYGFSVPKMMGIDRETVSIGNLLVPPVVHGVRCLSMGFFVADEQPVIWRGPMLHKTLEQFLTEAYWGEPDFLLLDMPPGTGDVALSLGQYLPRTEVMVVTTPQPAAQRVAQRAAFAAKRLKLSVRGVVENMSWFTGNDGRRYELFGAGGGELLAESLEVTLLGRVPFVPEVREGADTGVPVRVTDPGGEAARAFDSLADAVEGLGPSRIYRSELKVR